MLPTYSPTRHLTYWLQLHFFVRYINSGHAHVRYRIGKNLTGTPRYASINNHDGVEQSRRDDLESLGYVFMYFVRGSLPWQGLRAKNKIMKFQKIHHKKVQVSLDELCAGFPPEFKAYLHYCRRLAFEESPDYTYLKGLFKKVMINEGFKLDSKFDWMVSAEDARESKESKQRSQYTRGGGGEKSSPPPKINNHTSNVGNRPGSSRQQKSRAGDLRLVYNGGSRTSGDRANSAPSHRQRQDNLRPAMQRNDSIRGLRKKASDSSNPAHTGTHLPRTANGSQTARAAERTTNSTSTGMRNTGFLSARAVSSSKDVSGRPSTASSQQKKTFKLGERVII